MNPETEKKINYSFLCLLKFVLMKNGYEWQEEGIDQDGKVYILYKKNNRELKISNEFWMDAQTITFHLNPTIRIQVMKSIYCKDGQFVDRDGARGFLIKKMENSLPSIFTVSDKFLLTGMPSFSSNAYIDIGTENKNFGRIIFKLYSNVPKATANFRALCHGENNWCYVGSKITHIFPQYIIRGGDITSFDGTGGTSIFGPTFNDENFENKHSKCGILSMVNFGLNTNNSQFFISSIALPYFDGKYVAVGEVVSGMDVINSINTYGTITGKPLMDILIIKCGVMDNN